MEGLSANWERSIIPNMIVSSCRISVERMLERERGLSEEVEEGEDEDEDEDEDEERAEGERVDDDDEARANAPGNKEDDVEDVEDAKARRSLVAWINDLKGDTSGRSKSVAVKRFRNISSRRLQSRAKVGAAVWMLWGVARVCMCVRACVCRMPWACLDF